MHPTEGGRKERPSGTADISFYCDDIEKTVRELKSRGVEFTHAVEDHGYGLVTRFKVPGEWPGALAICVGPFLICWLGVPIGGRKMLWLGLLGLASGPLAYLGHQIWQRRAAASATSAGAPGTRS